MNTKENQTNKNTTTSTAMLTGMFRDRESTENAYNTMQEKGYTKDEINLVMSDNTRNKYFLKRTGAPTKYVKFTICTHADDKME